MIHKELFIHSIQTFKVEDITVISFSLYSGTSTDRDC